MAGRSSRRCFLKKSAVVAAGAIAAPHFIPSGVLAAGGRPGANDRVGVGYIGVGRRGCQLMDLPPDAQIIAVCDLFQPRAMAVAAKRQCRAYVDYHQLLDAADVDAVVVATPDHWHTLPAIHACQAAKDVYCEKPLTLTVREGQLLVEAARKYDRVFQTGSQQRSMAANRMGCELIRNGAIGNVHTVLGGNYPSPWICRLPGQPVPDGLDWDRWCGQTEIREFHNDIFVPRAQPGWISFQRYSGGEMTGWGSHGLDQVQWGLGTDASGPVEVWTEGSPFDPPTYEKPESLARGNKACSQPIVHFRYEGGPLLKLDGGGPPGGAVFIGDQGKITIDRGRVSSDPPEIALQPPSSHRIKLSVSDNHLANWIECIKTRERPVADVEIGHRSATLCHLGNIARWIGHPIQWDPKSEAFVGDSAANSLLSRPQRKPYELPDSV